MSAPGIIIRLELEAAPLVIADFLNDGEMARMNDWLDHHPAQAELIARALELAEAERAA